MLSYIENSEWKDQRKNTTRGTAHLGVELSDMVPAWQGQGPEFDSRSMPGPTMNPGGKEHLQALLCTGPMTSTGPEEPPADHIGLWSSTPWWASAWIQGGFIVEGIGRGPQC